MRRLIAAAVIGIVSLLVPTAANAQPTSASFSYDILTTPEPGVWSAVAALALPESVTPSSDSSAAIDGWLMAHDTSGNWFQVGWIVNPGGPFRWFSESERSGTTPVDTYGALPAWVQPGSSVNVRLESDGDAWSAYVYDGSGWTQFGSTAMPFNGSGATWEAAVETDDFCACPAPTYTMPSGPVTSFWRYRG